MNPVAFLIAGGLIVGVAGIIVLCYVWMRASRASQVRQESQQRQLLDLLQEQNDLLRRFLDKR